MPISRSLAIEHVRSQTARLSAHKQRSLWPAYVFHTTHITNAVEIVRHNQLLARNNAPAFHDVANQGALNAYSGSHDYARFYFRPKNGYHIRTEGIKCLADPYRQASQASIPVTFLFDFVEVSVLAGAKFTAGNIQKAANQELDGDKDFSTLDFNAIFHDDAVTPEDKDYISDRRMAEIMVPSGVPLYNTLRYIVFRTSYDLETFRYYLTQAGLNCNYKLAVEPVSGSVFMHWGLYVSELNFHETNLTIKFHFPRSKPADNIYRVTVQQKTKTGSRQLDSALPLTNPALTISNFLPDAESHWLINLEGVLAFEGRLAHVKSQIFG